MQSTIRFYLLFSILGVIGCKMHPDYFLVGKIQNNSSKNLLVLVSFDTIKTENQIDIARHFFIPKKDSIEIRVPNHPNFPPEAKWYFNYYDSDSLNVYLDSIKRQLKVSPVIKAYKRYLIKTDFVLDSVISKQKINLIF